MVEFNEKKTGKQRIFNLFEATTRRFRKFHLTKYYPLKIFQKKFLSLLKSDFAYVQGSKMFFLDDLFKIISLKGVWEEAETQFVKETIKEGEIVLDVGAHIGYYTLLFSKLVSSKGKVFAFEPSPKNFSLLKKNVEINGYQNVELINKAVSDKTGKTKLFLSEKNSGDNRIFDDGENPRSLDITEITLDDFFKDNKYQNLISLIKMDIQGAEGKAIMGMKNLLIKNKKLKLITEFWPYGLVKSGTNPNQLLLELSNLGFIPTIISKKGKKLQPTTIKELEKMSSNLNGYVNLLWIRKND